MGSGVLPFRRLNSGSGSLETAMRFARGVGAWGVGFSSPLISSELDSILDAGRATGKKIIRLMVGWGRGGGLGSAVPFEVAACGCGAASAGPLAMSVLFFRSWPGLGSLQGGSV